MVQLHAWAPFSFLRGGGARSPRQAHNLEIAGSNPAPATMTFRGVVALNWSEQRPAEWRRSWVRVPSAPLDLPCAAGRYLGHAGRRALSAGSQGGTSSPSPAVDRGPRGGIPAGTVEPAWLRPALLGRIAQGGEIALAQPRANGRGTVFVVGPVPAAAVPANRQTVHSLALPCAASRYLGPAKRRAPRPTRGLGRGAGSCGSRATGRRGPDNARASGAEPSRIQDAGERQAIGDGGGPNNRKCPGCPGARILCLHGASVVRPDLPGDSLVRL